jgi:hypothetical protein
MHHRRMGSLTVTSENRNFTDRYTIEPGSQLRDIQNQSWNDYGGTRLLRRVRIATAASACSAPCMPKVAVAHRDEEDLNQTRAICGTLASEWRSRTATSEDRNPTGPLRCGRLPGVTLAHRGERGSQLLERLEVGAAQGVALVHRGERGSQLLLAGPVTEEPSGWRSSTAVSENRNPQ